MIDPNFRPSNEAILEAAMRSWKYPYLTARIALNPEQKQKILDFNWDDDILATLLALEMDIEHDVQLATPSNEK